MTAMPPARECAALRPARNEDAAAIVDIVGRCFALYPGCVLDLEREERALLTPADSFERFWVLELDGRVVGTIAAATCERDGEGRWVELKKLYLDPEVHGRGLAQPLVEVVEDYARSRGARGIELWSDTRFTRAHRVYERYGYRASGRTRELHDLSDTVEYHFAKEW